MKVKKVKITYMKESKDDRIDDEVGIRLGIKCPICNTHYLAFNQYYQSLCCDGTKNCFEISLKNFLNGVLKKIDAIQDEPDSMNV